MSRCDETVEAIYFFEQANWRLIHHCFDYLLRLHHRWGRARTFASVTGSRRSR